MQHSHKEPHHLYSKSHKRPGHRDFKDELFRSLTNYKEAKESYVNCLLFPEVAMARIPFICPVPTAVCRGTTIFSLIPSTPAPGTHNTFAWTFNPEALVCYPKLGGEQDPFTSGSALSTANIIPPSFSMSSTEIFPEIQFDSMSGMRIVGASLTVTQTQKTIDRAGYGLISRIYGVGNTAQSALVSRNAVINAVYKDQCNFSDQEEDNFLRMIYAPADFTDLAMTATGSDQRSHDNEGFPVIQGFVTGYTDPIILTFEFNVVFEYLPKPILYQMVERSAAIVNPMLAAKADNAVANADTGVSPSV